MFNKQEIEDIQKAIARHEISLDLSEEEMIESEEQFSCFEKMFSESLEKLKEKYIYSKRTEKLKEKEDC